MQAFGIVYTVVFLAATISTHLIAYRWAMGAFPKLARFRGTLIAVCALFIALQPITRQWMHRAHSSLAGWLHAADLFELLTVALAAAPLGLILLARRQRVRRKPLADARGSATAESVGDAGSREPAASAPAFPAASAPAFPAASASERFVSRRDTLERIAGLGVVGAAGSVLGWGALRGRYELEVTEVVVKLAGLPRALDGYVIAQISDIHAGQFVGESELADGMARIASQRPDLVVATGDLVDYDPAFARTIARKLADLAPRDGVAAILGNHDYYAGAPAIEAALRDAGVDVLLNRAKHLRAGDGGGFALLGVDDLWAPRYSGAGADLPRALAAAPPDVPKILLSHQPHTVDLWKGQVALQLSGHTHGGQINPGFRPAALFMPYLAGRYQVGGTTLYVNRGFGTAGPPARVGAPPEITKIVLVAA